MGQRLSPNYAAEKDVILSSKEECALDMGQMSNNTAVKDAQIQSSEEVYTQGMGHKRRSLQKTWDMGQMSNETAVNAARGQFVRIFLFYLLSLNRTNVGTSIAY
jgi:hypothetical protein